MKDHIALEQLRNVEEKWHDAHARVKYVMVQAQSAASRAKRRRMLFKKKQREFDEQRKKLLMMRDLNSEINIGSKKSSSGSGGGDSGTINTSTNKIMKNKKKSNHSLASKVIAATKSTMRQPRKSSSDKENVKENGSTEKGEVEDVFRLKQNLNDCNLRNIQVLAEKKKKEATLNSLDTNQYGDDEKMDALALQYMHLPSGMRTKLQLLVVQTIVLLLLTMKNLSRHDGHQRCIGSILQHVFNDNSPALTNGCLDFSLDVRCSQSNDVALVLIDTLQPMNSLELWIN